MAILNNWELCNRDTSLEDVKKVNNVTFILKFQMCTLRVSLYTEISVNFLSSNELFSMEMV